MNIPVSDAKGILTDLVRRAEHGEDIVLTRHGRAVARLVAIVEQPSEADRRAILNAVDEPKAGRKPRQDRVPIEARIFYTM